mmetsp:Transcript_28938/g.94218  ORF Transcript_28938/g.94218 Transcript_28938/m.94218 type:complete len:216 (+) Transcript_28938:270-917(+)
MRAQRLWARLALWAVWTSLPASPETTHPWRWGRRASWPWSGSSGCRPRGRARSRTRTLTTGRPSTLWTLRRRWASCRCQSCAPRSWTCRSRCSSATAPCSLCATCRRRGRCWPWRRGCSTRPARCSGMRSRTCWGSWSTQQRQMRWPRFCATSGSTAWCGTKRRRPSARSAPATPLRCCGRTRQTRHRWSARAARWRWTSSTTGAARRRALARRP